MPPDVTGYTTEHAQEAEGQQRHWSHQLGSRNKFLCVRESRRGKADARQQNQQEYYSLSHRVKPPFFFVIDDGVSSSMTRFVVFLDYGFLPSG
jgi:hypothetical protein